MEQEVRRVEEGDAGKDQERSARAALAVDFGDEVRGGDVERDPGREGERIDDRRAEQRDGDDPGERRRGDQDRRPERGPAAAARGGMTEATVKPSGTLWRSVAMSSSSPVRTLVSTPEATTTPSKKVCAASAPTARTAAPRRSRSSRGASSPTWTCGARVCAMNMISR